MNRAEFIIAKVCRDERRLAKLSDSTQHIIDDLRDKTVSVVGNARSLSQTKFGAQIDQADIVIRINSSPIPAPQSHGQRTTWIATSIPLPADIIATRSPQRVLWMTSKRKRLPWSLATRDGFYINPAARHQELILDMGCRPTTGVMVLDMLRRTPVRDVAVFGFDFFASLSLSGARTAAQVPHDFSTEKQWADHLFKTDDRFNLIKTE